MSILRDSIFNAPGACRRCYMGSVVNKEGKETPCPVCRNWSDEKTAEELRKLRADIEEAESR